MAPVTTSDRSIAMDPEAPPVLSPSKGDLGSRIYAVLYSDKTLRSGLKLDLFDRSVVKVHVIDKLLGIRARVLALPEYSPARSYAVSSKNPEMLFGTYGKANMRLSRGETTITLPHIKPLQGAIKIVKYVVIICPGECCISLEMVSKIKKELRTPQKCKKLIETAKILGSFTHPNILRPTDILIPSHKKGYELFTPKCEMDLVEFLQKPIDFSIRYVTLARDCIRYMQEITLAMKYVHDRGYLHCDLKPKNVLLQKNPDGILKAMLTDFDFLGKYDDTSQVLRGTLPYVPPSYMHPGMINDLTTELYALGKTFHFNPGELDSFTGFLSRLEIKAKSMGNIPLSKAMTSLIADITALSERLTQDKISEYTTVLKELDKCALRFEKSLRSVFLCSLFPS